jgi:MFS transporter, DHA2 family, multidrug resistance protein
MVLVMPLAGLLYNRLGLYVMLPFGLALSGAAGLMMARFTLDTGPFQILLPQLIQGVGFAFMFVALSTATLATIAREQMQSATGLYNLIRQLGGSIGTAAVITILDHKTTTASAALMRYASASNPLFRQWWHTFQAALAARGSDVYTAHRQALAALQGLIHQQALVVAFDYDFALVSVAFFVCLPLVALMRRGRGPAQRAPIGE